MAIEFHIISFYTELINQLVERYERHRMELERQLEDLDRDNQQQREILMNQANNQNMNQTIELSGDDESIICLEKS